MLFPSPVLFPHPVLFPPLCCSPSPMLFPFSPQVLFPPCCSPLCCSPTPCCSRTVLFPHPTLFPHPVLFPPPYCSPTPCCTLPCAVPSSLFPPHAVPWPPHIHTLPSSPSRPQPTSWHSHPHFLSQPVLCLCHHPLQAPTCCFWPVPHSSIHRRCSSVHCVPHTWQQLMHKPCLSDKGGRQGGREWMKWQQRGGRGLTDLALVVQASGPHLGNVLLAWSRETEALMDQLVSLVR